MMHSHLHSDCFQAVEVILAGSGKSVRIDALKEGDRVLTESGFEDYMGLFHANTLSETVVLQLGNVSQVELTSDHLIAAAASGFKYAGHVTVGERLVMHGVNGDPSAAIVTKIHVSKTLVAAPLTRSGTIIINGVVVSCYATIPYHGLAHAVFFPYRVKLVRDLGKYASLLETMRETLPQSLGAMLGVTSM